MTHAFVVYDYDYDYESDYNLAAAAASKYDYYQRVVYYNCYVIFLKVVCIDF